MAIEIYTRAAVGEFTAFAFVPLVFLGLWSILCGDKKKWLCLPVGLTFLLVSHVLSAFAAVLLCAVFFLCYLGRVIKEPRRLLYIGYAVLVFAVLSASFLFPMLEQMASGTFLSTDGTSATYYGTLTRGGRRCSISTRGSITSRPPSASGFPTGWGCPSS